MPDKSAIGSTLVGSLIERVNGGQLSNGAVLAPGGSIGLEDLALDQLAEQPTVRGDDLTVVAPAGLRTGFGKAMDKVGKAALIVGPGGSTDEDAVEVAASRDDGGGGVFVTEAKRFFPAGAAGTASDKTANFDKTASFTPGLGEWLDPGATAIKLEDPGLPEDSDVLLFTGEYTPEEIFGTPAEESPLTPVDAGATFETANTVFAAPAGVAFDGGDATTPVRAVFDAGSPAPLYGVTFGMGVLSTPDEQVAGESVSPLSGTDTLELLQREEAQTLLERAGVTDAEDVQWLAGPERVAIEDDLEVAVFGESPDDPGLESFAGVVSGDEGPWRVGVHVVRATPDDHLVVAGTHRWPTLSAEDAGTVVEEPPVSMARARELLAEAAGRLESR
jgi:hypothetical protein